jgi:Class III cytochrome C family
MKRRLTFFMVIFCFSSGLFLVNSPSSANNSVPETMVLKTVTGKKPARFPHKMHQKNFACKECHHGKTDSGSISPYVEGMKIMKCATCHNNTDMKNPKFNSFKLAAHGLCKECHKQNRGSAPTKCTGCHIK